MTVIRFTQRQRHRANSRLFGAWTRYRRTCRLVALSIVAGIVAANILHAATVQTGWTTSETARHILAIRNCDAARAVGLAPARRGEPGYYDRHDRDKDGIACEVWRGQHKTKTK